MTTKNNAARVAVQAAALPAVSKKGAARACSAMVSDMDTIQNELQKAPAAINNVASIPTQAQTMRLAVTMVARLLQDGINAACGDNWRDEHSDCVSAAELALGTVERLGACLPMGFVRQWSMVGGAVRLVVAAYPDKDSVAWRHFNAAAMSIAVFDEALEFAGEADACEVARMPLPEASPTACVFDFIAYYGNNAEATARYNAHRMAIEAQEGSTA